MKHISRLSLIGALFTSFLLIGSIPSFAQCDEGDPNCPIEPPQSVEVNPDAVEAEGSTTDVEDPGALEVVESDLSGDRPAIIDPVPLAPRAPIAPAFGKLVIPMRWQQPTDVSCGVQALGMAFEGLGDGSPSSPTILDFLQKQGMMYDFGTGVEELAFSAQKFGYKGTIPFHNWGLGQLQAELAEGRAPVVALGANGPGQPGHFVTITGFSPDSEWVSYNDPILGEKAVTIDKFNRLWGLQGNTGVAVRKTIPAGEFDPVPWVAFVAGLMAVISQTPWALQRKGIGGRLMAGGSTSRRKTQAVRRRSLGGVPSRAANAAVRRKPPKSRPTPRPRPPRDPSPQMYNQPLVPNNKTEKLVWKAPEPVAAVVPELNSDPVGWFKAQWDNVVKPVATGVADFVSGAVMQTLNDLSFGAVEKFSNLPWERNESRAAQYGRTAGRVISTVIGAAETVFGAAAMLGGSTLILPTAAAGGACAAVTVGWCIPLAGGALALETAVVAAGAVVTAHGVGVIAHNITQPLRFSSRGTRGGWESKKTEYGETIEARRLSDREVRDMGLHQEKLDQRYGGKDTIYIDRNGDTWIQGKDGGPLIDFP